MKYKFKIKIFSLITILLLLVLCGCQKEKKEIAGTYYNYLFDDYTGKLELYKNGTCEFSYKEILYGEERINARTVEYCSYKYKDDRVLISYNNFSFPKVYLKISCDLVDNTLNCGDAGKFEKNKN